MAYTGIRFYIREKNKWSNLLKLHAGFDASFVLDKTTDSANISFITTDEPTCLKINMWVCLFINADEDVPTFNEDGTPKNHEQFIIGGYQYYKTLAGYEISLKLIEPIERFRGVMGETLSYTNQTTKVQDGIPYTKEPYNYYSALKRWLQVTPANTDDFGTDGEKRTAQGEAWWNRVKILDVDFLKGLPFADDTFNELSLYDLLFDVYDSGTGRTPVAYFDIDATTNLPNNVERDEYLLKFIRQDGLDKPVLEWGELTENKGNGEVCSGIMKREDGANYATGLVANITNLSPNLPVTFPAQGVYVSPSALNDDVRDTTTPNYDKKGTGYWVLRLPFKIKNVKRLFELEIGNKDVGTNERYDLRYYGTARNIMERSQKIAITDIKDESIDYFEEGDNCIYLCNYQYRKHDVYNTSVIYYVEYEPLVDARVLIGDSEYVQQVNQTSSQVDSERFGKFMTDYLAGMAKADYTIQRTTEKPQDYIDLIGSRVRRDEKVFMITNISIRNRNFQFDVFFQLNENHVRKNMSYQAPQSIRSNTAIQYSNIQDRKTVIRDKVICSLDAAMAISPTRLQQKYKIAVFNALLPHSIFQDVNPDLPGNYYPQFVNIENTFEQTGAQQFSTNISPFLIGNNICYNMQFPSNAISGIELIIDDEYFDFGRVKGQIPKLYTDLFGEVKKTGIEIISAKADIPVDGDTANIVWGTSTEREFNNAKDTVYDSTKIGTEFLTAQNVVIKIPSINLQKDMLEMYNITYMLEVGGQDIYVYPEMLKYARLLNQTIVSDKLHFIGYDGYDGTGDVIAEADVGYQKVTHTDSSITFNAPLENAQKNVRSLLVQSFMNGNKVNCLMINNIDYKHSLAGNSVVTINF